MARAVVLGGGGGIGRVAARALACVEGDASQLFDEIVVADLRLDVAEQVVRELGSPRARAIQVDATSPASLASALAGARVAIGCIGPFYRFGLPVLEAAIAAKVDYVDVCDDLAPTRQMLELDGRAREAGITAIVGMGNSPGLANVFVRLCADQLLDAVKSVDIYHVHGGEPDEGPAVLKHRIHAMTNDVPLFLDGQMTSVRQLDASGEAHVHEEDFRGVGRLPVYPYPHPETITLPQHIPGLERATNMGVVYPLSYFHLTQAMVRAGVASEVPLRVHDHDVVPLEFMVAHVLRERPRLLREAGITGPGGCLKVVVGGLRRGEPTRYELSVASKGAGAGEGTGIPAAVGALLARRGAVKGKGVLPPEAAVEPLDVLGVAMQIVDRLGVGGGDTLVVEKIDARGERTVVPIGFTSRAS